MKKAVMKATGFYFGIWGVFGLSCLFWYTVAPESSVVMQLDEMLRWFGVIPFKVDVVNVSAALLAWLVCYVMCLGAWLGMERTRS